MHRALCLLPLLTCLPLATAAQTARFDPVFTSGIFGAFCQQVSVGEMPAPGTAAQKIDLIPGTPDIRWPGPQVPATPGISFGIRTETLDGVALSPVLIEVTHPPFLRSGVTRQSYVTGLGGDGASINAYSFDTAEELVTVTWTFRAYHDGKTLYEVQFNVVPADALPHIAGGCDGYFGS